MEMRPRGGRKPGELECGCAGLGARAPSGSASRTAQQIRYGPDEMGE